MALPPKISEITAPSGGTILDYTNTEADAVDICYASFSAKAVVRAEIRVNTVLIDVVFAGAGGSHSWWSMGPLLDEPLKPGDRLVVTVDGPSAFRINYGKTNTCG